VDEDRMMKTLTIALLFLAVSAQTGLCDWHHHYGYGSGGAPDPNFDAFMWTSILILAASAAILLLVGPVIVIRTRRIRDLFWVVPLVNTVLYILSISLRSYPGGFVARFQPPGLANTILEILLLLVSSLFVALILAIIQWITRTVKRFTKKQEPNTEQSPPPLPRAPQTGHSEGEG
jgi:hypothetical protein